MASLEKQKTESGQATVETILLIAISVVLIVALMKEIYQPFGKWVSNYMTSYLECLLDYGELPTINSNSTNNKCAAKFIAGPKGTIAGMNGSSSSNPGGASSTGPKAAPLKGGLSERHGDQLDGSSSDAKNAAQSSSSNPSGHAGDSFGSNSGQKSFQVSKDPAPNIEETGKSQGYVNARGGSDSSVTSSSGEGGGSFTTGLISSSDEKKSMARPSRFLIPKGEESEDVNKPRKFLINNSERKVAAEEPETNWSFGEYLKYALILAIIIAIVLFLGGQILQISKSMEKK